MNRKERIHTILSEGLMPSQIEIIDDSAKHAGHAGARPEGETHYTVKITSAAFAGKSKVQMHQMVYALLDDEFKAGLHALAIQAKAP